jgi:DNA-binding transcriptional LysR family regulator
MLLESTHEFPAAIRGGWMIPPDPGFEIRHLRYFVAVAEHLHFGRAARALNISQPPLSRQIQDLEYQVGAQLLCRSSKSVTLTPVGQVFLAETKRVLSQVYRSLDSVRRASAGEGGCLNVGFSAFLEGALLPSVRAAVTATLRETTVHLHRLDPEEQIRLIRNRTLDAGLVLLPIENADQIRVEQLFRSPAVALVAASHPFATYSQISLHEVASASVVEVGDDLMVRSCNHVERIAKMCGLPVHVKRHAPDLERLFEDVRHAGSVAVLPCCAKQLAGQGICCVPIVEPEADFTFGVAYRRDREDSLLERFLETLNEVNLRRPPRCAHTGTRLGER